MKIKLLSAIILSGFSLQATAHEDYWLDSNGDYVHDRNGHCVRTPQWSAKNAVPECEGGVAKAAAKPAPAPAPKAAPKAAPAPAPVAEAAPQYTSMSLASGATFNSGGSTLSAEGKAEVAALMAKFKGETVESIVVEGHTDSRGAASFNQQLSEKRAEAVKAELVANGVDAAKITTVGHGESKPIADNMNKAGRAENRRVTIKVDGKQRQL